MRRTWLEEHHKDGGSNEQGSDEGCGKRWFALIKRAAFDAANWFASALIDEIGPARQPQFLRVTGDRPNHFIEGGGPCKKP